MHRGAFEHAEALVPFLLFRGVKWRVEDGLVIVTIDLFQLLSFELPYEHFFLFLHTCIRQCCFSTFSLSIK